METTKKFCLAALSLWLACAPSSADRTVVSDDAGNSGGRDAAADLGMRDAGTGGTGAVGSGGATGGAGGRVLGGAGGGPAGGGGTGQGGGGGDAAAEIPTGTGGDAGTPDQGPDVATDVFPDGGTGRKAHLVVGDPKALSKGDQRMQALLVERGFEVVLIDDNTAAAVNGVALVVLCSSSMASNLAARYRDVAVPVLDLESAVYDDMKMTAANTGTDFDEVPDTLINILPAMQAHPLAAGKMGQITVNTNGSTGVNWGKPAATAIAIASLGATANPNKLTIFAYETGAKMIGDFPAPARRMGLFAADTTLQNLSPDGAALVTAALAWLAP